MAGLRAALVEYQDHVPGSGLIAWIATRSGTEHRVPSKHWKSADGLETLRTGEAAWWEEVAAYAPFARRSGKVFLDKADFTQFFSAGLLKGSARKKPRVGLGRLRAWWKNEYLPQHDGRRLPGRDENLKAARERFPNNTISDKDLRNLRSDPELTDPTHTKQGRPPKTK
jgi:hypothetical protein